MDRPSPILDQEMMMLLAISQVMYAMDELRYTMIVGDINSEEYFAFKDMLLNSLRRAETLKK